MFRNNKKDSSIINNLYSVFPLMIPEKIFSLFYSKSSFWGNLRLFKKIINEKKELKYAKNIKAVLIKEEIPQFNFWVFNKVIGMMAYFDAIGQPYHLCITANEENFDIIKTFFVINDAPPSDSYTSLFTLGDESILNIDDMNIFNPIYKNLVMGLYKKYFNLPNYIVELKK